MATLQEEFIDLVNAKNPDLGLTLDEGKTPLGNHIGELDGFKYEK